jgi:hypothetical protein
VTVHHVDVYQRASALDGGAHVIRKPGEISRQYGRRQFDQVASRNP